MDFLLFQDRLQLTASNNNPRTYTCPELFWVFFWHCSTHIRLTHELLVFLCTIMAGCRSFFGFGRKVTDQNTELGKRRCIIVRFRILHCIKIGNGVY